MFIPVQALETVPLHLEYSTDPKKSSSKIAHSSIDKPMENPKDTNIERIGVTNACHHASPKPINIPLSNRNSPNPTMRLKSTKSLQLLNNEKNAINPNIAAGNDKKLPFSSPTFRNNENNRNIPNITSPNDKKLPFTSPNGRCTIARNEPKSPTIKRSQSLVSTATPLASAEIYISQSPAAIRSSHASPTIKNKENEHHSVHDSKSSLYKSKQDGYQLSPMKTGNSY